MRDKAVVWKSDLLRNKRPKTDIQRSFRMLRLQRALRPFAARAKSAVAEFTDRGTEQTFEIFHSMAAYPLLLTQRNAA